MSTTKSSTATNAATLNSATQSELYNAGKALAIAEAGFDFSIQSCVELVIKTAKPSKAKPIPFAVFDTISRAICAGYDSAELNAKYSMSDAARQKRSRIKSSLLAEYGFAVADKPAATSKDATAKAAQREKSLAQKKEIADQLAAYMKAEDVALPLAEAELVARKSTAAERKQVRQAAAYMVEVEEAKHAERVKTAKATISKFMSGIKGNNASPEQLEILEQLADVINGDADKE